MAPDAVLGPRQMNRLHVLEALHLRPACSRAELTRHTGLSRATVSSLVEELVAAGLVEENIPNGGSAAGDTGLGRPPVLLSLMPRAAFAVGLDFGHEHIRVAVCDLAGEPVVDDFSLAQVDHAPGESLDLAFELVRAAVERAGIAREAVLGVGMGLAVPINRRTGELEAEGILPGWRDIRPAREMQSRLGLPVTLDNDANVGALGESAFGAGRGARDMVYVRLSAGIGAGLILNGRPYHGRDGVAGEIGHVLSDPMGPICRCGNRGCLEAVASPVAVAALLEPRLGGPVSVADLLELIDTGDRGARRAVAEAGEAVGRALAMLVNVLNPELVVVGGDLARAGEILLDPIAAAIERHSVAPAGRAVRIVPGQLGDRAEVLGAAALVLADAPRALVQRLAVR